MNRRRITLTLTAAALTLVAAVAWIGPANADATPVMPAYLSSGLAECKAQQAVATTIADRAWANECVRLAQRAVDAWVKANPTPTPTATGTPTATPTTIPPTTPPVTTPPATTPPPTTVPPTTVPPTTPPVTSACPAYPAVPDASCTGWRHTGVTLKAVGSASSGTGWHVDNGNFYVDQANAVVDGLDIPFCVVVLADNVTIQRSRITCSSTSWVVRTFSDTSFSALTMTDVEIDGLGSDSSAIYRTASSHYTRLDVHGFATSGPRLASDNVFEDSWIHDFVCLSGGHSAGLTANDGGNNITVRHNNIDPGNSGCMTAAFEFAQDSTAFNGGSYTNVTVTQNLFNGGKYCMYAAVTAPGTGSVSNMAITGNTFGRRYNPECGDFGPLAQFDTAGGNTFSGNVWGEGMGAHNVGDPVVL